MHNGSMPPAPYALPEITTVARLGLLGGGNLPFVLEAIATFRTLGAPCIVYIGDSGRPEPKGRDLDLISAHLSDHRMSLYLLDGTDKVGAVRSNISYTPLSVFEAQVVSPDWDLIERSGLAVLDRKRGTVRYYTRTGVPVGE